MFVIIITTVTTNSATIAAVVLSLFLFLSLWTAHLYLLLFMFISSCKLLIFSLFFQSGDFFVRLYLYILCYLVSLIMFYLFIIYY